MCSWSSFSWVSPFRNRRIKGYLLLPGAYRSLSRLSSALSAKASTICSFMLDQIDSYRFKIWMLAPSVALIWFRFYNSFHRWNMVYRNHLVLILGHRLFSEVIQYFRCTLGCLDISSDIQCAVFKEQCLRWYFTSAWHSWSCDLLTNCCRSVEIKGFEPLTPCLQGRCSPNWAIPP